MIDARLVGQAAEQSTNAQQLYGIDTFGVWKTQGAEPIKQAKNTMK